MPLPPRTRTLGSIFSALTLSGTVATTIGVCLAYVQRAPIWAYFLFFGGLLANIPLGGIVGYLFHTPGSNKLNKT